MANLVVADATSVTDIALRESGKAADAALMDIAENGDEYALEVVRNLSPAALAQIVREHDYTVPSILGLLCEPSDVVALFEKEPMTWRSVTEDNVSDFIRDVSDVVTSIILSKDDEEWRQETFEAIAESDDATLYVAIAFLGKVRHEVGEEFSFHNLGGGVGTLDELLRSMKELCPELITRIAMVVCGKMNWHYGNEIAVVREVYNHAHSKAMQKVQEAESMFESL